MELEENEYINFLDKNIHRNLIKLDMRIFRKPTSTDVIPHSSNHPASHKSAAFHYMLDRALRLLITDEEILKERTVIKTIATNSGYMFHDIEKAHNRQKRENNNKSSSTLSRIVQPQTKDEKIWVKFPYFDDRITILTIFSGNLIL
jgi:hypothetical protein